MNILVYGAGILGSQLAQILVRGEMTSPFWLEESGQRNWREMESSFVMCSSLERPLTRCG